MTLRDDVSDVVIDALVHAFGDEAVRWHEVAGGPGYFEVVRGEDAVVVEVVKES